MLRIAAAFCVLLLALPAAAAPIQKLQTPGGLEAWLVGEPSIPILALELAFRGGGSASDPAGREGLANLVSGLLDEGAGEMKALAFQKRLEELAISLNFDSGKDTFRVSLRTLSKHRDEAFRMLGLALTAARFDTEPLERVRNQVLAGIERRAEDPDSIAGRTWFAKAFPDHPYGRPGSGTKESVKAIDREGLKDFVSTRLARDNVLVAAVGDIAPKELARLLDLALGDLPKRATALELRPTKLPSGGSLTVVRKAIPQSVVSFGLPGIMRQDPDWYAAYVMNYVLGGGGFTSRLYQEVREKRGLAYSVYTYLYPYQYAAAYLGGVATANARVADSLALVRSELDRLAGQGISDQELADAKTFLNGSFPLRLDSNSKIAGILISMQLYRLGIDYLEKRSGYIAAVSAGDVRRVAKRLLRSDDLIVVVVGDPAGLETGDSAD
ncbi:MAG: pitrilysin family protein [Alphaproteobacteria bacterium]|jgi:zinc protease|nr:peptidase M16 [Rhodospirillaceae bacterium]MDP6405949.1 pitrilysin family protein [Alphaproteobacteria bacterium]MDP6623202.1 pitrilysin family protein [Alphaproteobacteria bacterium]|tara:strand:- start:673 stop:1995 length:1323 start_codon:yes stop_codon:yes gene_type:complete